MHARTGVLSEANPRYRRRTRQALSVSGDHGYDPALLKSARGSGETSVHGVSKENQFFYQAGCISCDAPKFATRVDYEINALARQFIWPNIVLFLHDMGEGLADNRSEGRANGRKWRTPPIWGIGFTKTMNGHTQFLHDGRARNLTEATLWHGGKAQDSKDLFVEMSKEDRNYLLRFLSSF